jgi:CRP/FNR family transcriptional regulator, cyclic AMP receptor protein
MAATASVSLLDVEPGIGGFLDEEDRAAARALVVPVRSVAQGTTDVSAKLQQAGAFAAVVLEGMLMQELRLGDRTAARLLGPGDIVSAPAASGLASLDAAGLEAAAPTRVATLGNEVLAAVRRWPALMAGLHVSTAQQAERLAAQLVVCQMPRVDERLMALLWLLANSWGRVTVNGTILPLRITHSTLGALIGARRPTVTLALGELTERGAIVIQDQGWLLVDGPPGGRATKPSKVPAPVLEPDHGSIWTDDGADERRGPGDIDELTASYQVLMDTVSDLRQRHEQNVNRARRQLSRLRASREEWQVTRSHIQQARVSRHQPPSA